MVYQCYSPGLPYIYLQLFPMEIVQTPEEVIDYSNTIIACATFI